MVKKYVDDEQNTQDFEFSELSFTNASLCICVKIVNRDAIIHISDKWLPNEISEHSDIVIMKWDDVHWLPYDYEYQKQLAGYLDNEDFEGKAVLVVKDGDTRTSYYVTSPEYKEKMLIV